jgi:2-polyprenyl-6-methoxyphenol hydroxylase-like FAD-dependent oxidoreductase
MSARPLKIVSVGAGISGCVFAHILRDEPGVEIELVERAETANHSDAGTGLNIGPNAMKALAGAAPDLHDLLRSASLPWESWRIWLADGSPLMDLPLSEVAETSGIRLRWSALYAELRKPLGRAIRYSATAVAMQYGPDGKLSVGFEARPPQGPSMREAIDGVDLLVAGDGRYSRVRETFLGTPMPRHIGVCIYRLLIPDTSGGLIDDYGQWFNGPNRLLAFRVPGAAIYIGGAFPIPDGAGDVPRAMKTPEALATCYTPADRAPCPPVAWMIEQLVRSVREIHWARLQEIDIAFHDRRGRVLLLGDAAHAMVPTLGQGATSAIEDACFAGYALRRAIRAAREADIELDLPAVLAEIDRVRRPRISGVMDLSRDATDTLLAGADPVEGTRHKTTPEFRERLRWLYCDTPRFE